MEKILVIYGGKSVEHDISIITGLQAMSSISAEYQIIPIYIDWEGKFWTGENLDDVNIYADFEALVKNKKQVLFGFGEGCVYIKKRFSLKRINPSSAIVCMHGINGEDGCISAILQMSGINYTCPCMQSSAICMDKLATKIMLIHYGIDVVDFVSSDQNLSLQEIAKKLQFPIIVKPSRCGSSIGIEKCDNLKQLKFAVEVAQKYDKKVLFEHFIQNGREFNCACIKNGEQYFLSKVCQVKSKNFYSFDEKYLQEKPSSTFNVEKSLAKRIKDLTKKVVEVLQCEGVVRVDFLMDEDGKLFVNEVNTIPGSLAFYLFGSMRDVCCQLIEQSKNKVQEEVITKHSSQALEIFANANMNNYSKK